MDHPLWKDRFEHTQEIARYCGPVPSGMVKHTVKDRVMLLGDAAGMAKPTTGGGIGQGSIKFNAFTKNLHRPSDQINSRKKTSRPSPNNLGAL